MAADQHINGKPDHRRHSRNPSDMDQQRHNETDRKSSAGRNEPTADHGKHTRYTVDGTLASPGMSASELPIATMKAT